MNFVIKSNSSQQFGANLGCANNSIDLVLNGSENGFVWHLVIYPLLISFCVEKQLHFFGANYIVRKSETSYFFFVCYCLLCLFLIAIITQIFNVVSFSLSPSVAGYMCRFVIYGMHKAHIHWKWSAGSIHFLWSTIQQFAITKMHCNFCNAFWWSHDACLPAIWFRVTFFFLFTFPSVEQEMQSK